MRPAAWPMRSGVDHEQADPVRVRSVRLIFERAVSIEEVGRLGARIQRVVAPDTLRVEIDRMAP